MKKRLMIIGCSTTGKHLLEFIRYYDLFDVVGFAVNKEYKQFDEYCGLPVYELEKLNELHGDIFDFVFVAVLWNKVNADRKRIYNMVKKMGLQCANIISPTAKIRGTIEGDNCWIHDYAIIQNNTFVSSGLMMMAQSLIGANTQIGEHCFLGAKSLIGGGSKIGNQTFIGLNATVFDNVKIGEKCIIGACTSIKRNVPSYTLCKIANTNCQQIFYDEKTIEDKLQYSLNVR